MEILTGGQMRRVDRYAIERLGIPSLTLMENAGRGVAASLWTDYPDLGSRRVVVLCGKGNNGGDGLVVARQLSGRDVEVRALLLARADELKGDAASNLSAARQAGVPVHEVGDLAAWRAARRALDEAPLVVDAILGTGVSGGARGLAGTVIEDLNQLALTVASVDLPSGLDADTHRVDGRVVRAQKTYTLCRPKLALALEPAARFAGSWQVVPIGIPDEAVQAEHPTLEWLDADETAALLLPRPVDSHKGSFGHLLAVAGSRGKSGAAVLVARGALRSGVGLVTVAAPSAARGEIAVQQSEVMTEPLPETARGTLAKSAGPRILALLSRRDALAMGPGLGTAAGTRAAILEVLRKCRAATVLDADALNAVAAAGRPGLASLRGASVPLVLTPHPGEAARLLDRPAGDLQQDRLEAVRLLASTCGAVTVLKGHRTLVATPDGEASVNSTGNPGMGSAGTGDVLTGVLGAFLAAGMPPRDAARLGVFVHGRAGDRAASRVGQDGMIAGDLVEELPHALRELRERKEHF